MDPNHPTPYPEVNALLHEVLVGAKRILGDHFVGMYLEGSLVSYDFDQDSDIDFVVVSDEGVSDEQFAALKLMHERIAAMDSWYADQLEGFYVPRRALRRYDPSLGPHPNIERGPGESLKMVYLGSAWLVHLSILRERGVTLAGPDSESLIDPITPQELQQAVAMSVREWSAHTMEKPQPLCFRGFQAYVVLTLCRILYTLHTGSVGTKRVAARWARAALDARWVPLIERAWEGRHNPAAERAASGGWHPLDGRRWDVLHDAEVSPEEVNETLEYLRYTTERSQQVEQRLRAG